MSTHACASIRMAARIPSMRPSPVEQIYASDKEIEAVFETLAPINSASGLRALVSAGSSADWLW
jgi:hypothetical protein